MLRWFHRSKVVRSISWTESSGTRRKSLSGVTTDVNYYDGSKAATRVELTGRFTFDDVAEWEIE